MYASTGKVACKQFDPANVKDGESVFSQFSEFCRSFGYSYDALNRKPPGTENTQLLKAAWIQQDKRRIFLGEFSSRNLQIEYEQATTEIQRQNMAYDDMVQIFEERFKLTSNITLTHYKFRKMKQNSDENFDQFCTRVKLAAKQCTFTCSPTCSVEETLVRDQIVYGARDEEFRKEALAGKLGLLQAIEKGRSCEVSNAGLASMKSEYDVNRTKPGAYSRRNRNNYQTDRNRSRGKNDKSKYDANDNNKMGVICKTCTSWRCRGGKACSARLGECHECHKKGHFKGAEICPKNKAKRRQNVNKVEESNENGQDSDAPESDDSEPSENTRRIFGKIKAVRLVGKVRKKQPYKRKSKYEIDVIIKEKPVTVFADTGAEICIMSKKVAKATGLRIIPTDMTIRPYNSPSTPCLGETIATVTYGERVANVKFYVVAGKSETLISGAVSEALGIIRFESIRRTQNNTQIPVNTEDREKRKIYEKFPRIFEGVGALKDYEVEFHIDESVKPVVQVQRQVPFHLRANLQDEIYKLLREGTIERHEGPAPWVSNLVLQPKDDGTLRTTLDMTKANKAIRKTNIPIPRPEQIKAMLSGYKYYSKIDLRSAFHQLTLSENSRMLTVFYGLDGLYRYKKLTMGSSPATGELSKALRPLFAHLKDVFVIHDDIIVAGKTRGEHDSNLHKMCEIIEANGLTLNYDKCLFAKKQIPWWGMLISDKGISPHPDKVKSIKNMAPPTSKDELKSLFCMIQSNSEFIPHLARKTTNIRSLLKKQVKFVWTTECQQEFELIRDGFSEQILLTYFDPTSKTVIYVDAHQSGLSAILTQVENSDDKPKIVAVASRATSETETRYGQIDLEALAIDFALRRFRFFIAGGPKVVIVTDHKPLVPIFNGTRLGSIRSERIKLRHQDLLYEIKWEKGSSNIADYLSRHALPLTQLPTEQVEETHEFEKLVYFLNFGPYLEAVSINGIISATSRDITLKSLAKAVKLGYIPKGDHCLKPFEKVFDRITISEDGLLLKDHQIILPEALIPKALEKAHKGGHPGEDALTRRLRSVFWFPRLRTFVSKFVKDCKPCALFTPKNRKNKLHGQSLADFGPWEKVSVDFFGPMPDSRHILVVQDMISKFPAAKILNNTDTGTTLKALQEIYATYGTPLIHRTDNGPPFNSHRFEEYSREIGTTHELSYPYHPQANPVECFMKPLGKAMKTAHFSGIPKEKALEEFLSAYRATPHSSNGLAPGDILLRNGYRNLFPTKAISDETVQIALSNSRYERDLLNEQRNATRSEPKLQIGDKVLLKNQNPNKFDPLYGPEQMEIVEIENEGAGAIVQHENGAKYRRHADDIKIADQSYRDVTPSASRDCEDSNDSHETVAEGEPQNIPRRSGRTRRPNTRLEGYETEF